VDLPTAPKRGTGIPALILSALGWCVLLFTLGFGSPVALPLLVTGWVSGREARRSARGRGAGAAVAGEALGITGALASLLFIAGCAALVASA
jgi:hypothetical protein